MRIALAAIALAVGLTLSAPAAAQSDSGSRDEAYFALKLMLGLAGDASVDYGNASSNDDLKLTYGGGLAYMVPLHRYFALGGQLAIQSWQTKGGDNLNTDRNVMGDLALVPQGRLPLTHDIELYIALPLGLSLDILNGASYDLLGLGLVQFDADNALGFTVSLLFGARFALSDNFGLLAEVGYTRHDFSHDVHAQALGVGATVNGIDVTLEQVALNLGAFF